MVKHNTCDQCEDKIIAKGRTKVLDLVGVQNC